MSVVDDAMGADAGGQTWSTDSIPEAEQFSSWADISSVAFCPVTVTREGDGAFRSRVTGRRIGAASISQLSSGPQSVARTGGHLRAHGGDSFFLNLPLSPGTSAHQDGRTALLSPGDFTVVDSARPFELDFSQHFAQISLAIPHELLAARLADVESTTAVRVAGGHGVGAVASTALQALAVAGPVDREAGHAMTDHVCGLIALALGSAAPNPRTSSRALLREAALAEVQRRLCDPQLSPAHVAQRLAISSRYLHSLFAERGTTFGRWVLQCRLQRCHAALADPTQAHRTVADIAYAGGFSDPSYFARAFRARYGITPRQLRG